MTVRLVINEPTRALNVEDVLLPLIDSHSFHTIRIAVSYTRLSGAVCVSAKLKRFIRHGGKVNLLFGDDFNISQSEALRLLQGLGVNLRLFVGDGEVNYHPKMWIFEGKRRQASLTGSSNLSNAALTTSVEANILLESSRDVIRQQISYFDYLWENYSYKEIDEEWIDHYVDVERSLAADVRYKTNGSVNHVASYKQISNFIEGWMRHVVIGKKRGQYERWRGWYIVPEPATIDDDRMLEFKDLLQAIRASKEYRRNGSAIFSVNYVNDILRKAKISYKGRGRMTLSAKGRRDLFIRQHKDYLNRLGFIRTLDVKGPRIVITPLGLQLLRSKTPERRKELYTNALHGVRWPWAPKMKLFDFLVQLMERLPSKRLYYHDLSFLVIHAEHDLMFRPLLDLTRMLKSLPKSMRSKLIRTYEQRLESKLTRRNRWAYYRYQRKIRELMALLGYADGFRYVHSPDDADKYIELISRKAISTGVTHPQESS